MRAPPPCPPTPRPAACPEPRADRSRAPVRSILPPNESAFRIMGVSPSVEQFRSAKQRTTLLRQWDWLYGRPLGDVVAGVDDHGLAVLQSRQHLDLRAVVAAQ